MTDIMNAIANSFMSWILALWNFCMTSWVLAFPIALAILSKIIDNLKRFLGK